MSGHRAAEDHEFAERILCISLQTGDVEADKSRSFSVLRNDTHGLADERFSTVPSRHAD